MSLRTAAGVLAVLLTSSLVSSAPRAQQEQFSSGQTVAPVYEGWERNPDGSFNLVFGYFNRNWEEEIDVPVGADNRLEPGDPERGQPTHFYPRRTRFAFRVRVPKDFGQNEVVWSLTTQGRTERAYGTLLPEYFIDKLVISANTGGAGGAGGGDPELHRNEPPTLKVDGGSRRSGQVGKPLTLVATARDDGIPKLRAMAPSRPGVTSYPAPNSATGLRVSWFVYRGDGKVVFDPTQISEWEDSRDGADSPIAPGWRTPPPPKDNTWIARATFEKPGTYVLRCQAHDGALPVVEDVTVVVTP